LLPLVARHELGQGPGGYGLLLTAIGCGAVTGALALPAIRQRLSSHLLVMLATSVFALTTAVLALSKSFIIACVAMLFAGWAWVAVLSSLNVAAQKALPAWVRARAIAVYLVVFYGGMAGGSLLWGKVASHYSISTALMVAAAGLLLGIVISARAVIGGDDEINLSPSLHWPAPLMTEETEPDRGPVMITVEYRIDPSRSDEFRQAMKEMRRMRRRDGAVFWGLFCDTADPARYVEYFMLNSWVEHLRQHERVTVADKELQTQIAARFLGDRPPQIAHFIAA
jgi:MFS family permease